MVYILGIALMGSFSPLRRLQAKSKVQVLFADDMTYGVLTEEKIQKRCGSSISFK